MLAQGVEFAKVYKEYGDDAAALYAFDPGGFKVEVSWHDE